MSNKFLVYAFTFFISALLLLFFSFSVFTSKEEENVVGQYTFVNTRNHLPQLDKIKMITPEGGEINIKRDGDIWRFHEAADYFCNAEMLAEFYRMVNDSLIMEVQKGNDNLFKTIKLEQPNLTNPNNNTQGTRITTYDEEGKVLDDIILGKITDDKKFVSAKKTGGNYVYKISEVGGFSGQPNVWIPYPLLSIREDQISAIIIDDKYFTKEYLMRVILKSTELQKILRILSFMQYGGIISKEDFYSQYSNDKVKTIKIETNTGLVYVFNIYEEEGTYWLQVKMDKTKISRKIVNDIIEKNKQYFENWLFQIPLEVGKSLFYADII